MYRKFLKRPFDLVVALVAVIAFAPLMLVTALAVRAALGSPVLFRQPRPGRHGIPFNMIKFRTMRAAAPGEDDAARLTAFGKLLRSLSLDELPELFNVVTGRMSLVGPRPLLMQYLDRYTPEQARRHDVRPGITGWAQVNGRNALSWERKFEFDVEYVHRCSFALDMRILALTLWQVVARHGINQPGQATAREFLGTAERDASRI